MYTFLGCGVHNEVVKISMRFISTKANGSIQWHLKEKKEVEEIEQLLESLYKQQCLSSDLIFLLCAHNNLELQSPSNAHRTPLSFCNTSHTLHYLCQ